MRRIGRFLLYSVLTLTLAGFLLPYIPRTWIPEKQLYNWANNTLIEKSGLSFAYGRLKLSAIDGAVFEGIRIYSDGEVLLRAAKLSLGAEISKETPGYIRSKINLVNAELRTEDLNDAFWNKISSLQSKDSSSAPSIFSGLTNTVLEIHPLLLRIGYEKAVVDVQIINFRAVKAAASYKNLNINISGNLHELDFPLTCEYRFGAELLPDVFTASGRFQTDGVRHTLLIDNARLLFKSNDFPIPKTINFEKSLFQSDNNLLQGNIFFSSGADVNGQASAYFDILSGIWSFNLQTLSWKNSSAAMFHAKNAEIKGVISSSQTNFSILLEQAVIDSGVLDQPLTAEELKLTWDGTKLKAADADISFHKLDYELSIDADLKQNLYSISTAGPLFDTAWLKLTSSSSNSSSRVSEPMKIIVNARMKQIKSDNIYAENAVINFTTDSNGTAVYDSKFYFDGNEIKAAANSPVNAEHFALTLSAASLKLHSINKLLDIKYQMNGIISAAGTLRITSSGLSQITVDFTNISPVTLNKTPLQLQIWNLPLFTSLKSEEDIFNHTSGRLLIEYNKETIYRLSNLMLHSGEYEILINGNITQGISNSIYQLSPQITYSPDFEKYLAVLQGWLKYKSEPADLSAAQKIKKWKSARCLKIEIPLKERK